MIKRVPRYQYRAECAEMHVLIEMIARGRDYFSSKMYKPAELIMHIPPMLQEVLVASLGRFGAKKIEFQQYILGVKCVPAYENRIVISHPKFAIYDNEPMVVIDLVLHNGQWYPVYHELNEID